MDDIKELEQQRERARVILENNEEKFENNSISDYSNEQVEEAQKQSAKNKINNLYSKKIIPYTNACAYLLYYVVSLITLPFVLVGNSLIPALISFGALFVLWFISKQVEKKIRKKMALTCFFIERLIDFSDETAIFCYIASSVGYWIALEDFSSCLFWIIYGVLVFIFFLCMIHIVIIPLIKEKCKHT